MEDFGARKVIRLIDVTFASEDDGSLETKDVIL
jgi:hypothetical protein